MGYINEPRKMLRPSWRIIIWDQTGFSMAELIVVAAVIGILALIAFTSWMAYVPASTLTGAARELQSNLNQARQLAVTTRQDIQVQVVPGGYQFLQGNSVPAPWAPWTGLNGEGTFRLANNVAIAPAGLNPIFTQFGTVRQAGGFTLTGPQARTQTVTVRPWGQITIP